MNLSRNAVLYRRYLETCPSGEPDEVLGDREIWRCRTWQEERRTRNAWLAMPLPLRVRLCWDCGWIDAVTEICGPLGRLIVSLRRA